MNEQREDRETYGATRRYLEEHLIPKRARIGNSPTIIAMSPLPLQGVPRQGYACHICGPLRPRHRLAASRHGRRRRAKLHGKRQLLQSGFSMISTCNSSRRRRTALEAALWRASRNGGCPHHRFPYPSMPTATPPEIKRHQTNGQPYRSSPLPSPGRMREQPSSSRVAACSVWYRGRMEFGRARWATQHPCRSRPR